ncbi:MAG: ribonuclease E/G, partial [Candidatus Angelobacter sp.]
RVTRVLPGMQSAFVNIGLERDAFLYVSDFLLEEEEDTEGLDQAILRSRPVITGPVETETQSSPMEAEEIIPPAEPSDEEHLEHVGGPADQENAHAEGDQDREGARKWRGRRRRRGRGGKFPEGDEREQREPSPEPVREIHNIREVQSEPAGPNDFERMVLPGESISKYQPHDHAEAAHPPSPRVSSSRPSTEYSLDAAAFSPGSMTLPGESIAKYRPSHGPGSSAVATEQRQQHEPRQHRFDAPVQESQSFEHAVQDERHSGIQPESIQSHSDNGPDVAAASPGSAFSENDDPSGHETARHAETGDNPRYAEMNVAGVFGGDAVEASQQSEAHLAETVRGGPEQSAVADADQPSTPYNQSSWQTGGRGVVEEEEIDEEESDLPGYEEHLDGTDYEELEEEVLAGNELTEAVRDAHINERATGQYEAEGLGSQEGRDAGDDDEGDDPDVAGDEEEFESEEAGDPGEEPEDARAEHRAAAGTAGYQQQRTERRPSHDRRGGGRKPARHMRGGRRNFTPRQLPAISDLLKEGQEILVQIAKEPIAKKGARITSHIALPGRFLVYMPTVHHTGVSRKIASEEDRHRLKRIVLSERGEAQGGFIVRTAAAGANEEDLRADIRFLINLWNEIRGRADTSKAPALIYHDLNLVERILRDQVTNSFSQIWADTEQEYER